ncbi:DUF4123 domain-containing protein [Chitinimonas sp. PSY-7]|uniref:DUF4123 domain-containing protein n=1 Tax=Chitinimonas sp. PSY-7 TaxID=3459088 RepID=UPI00403FE38B
MTKLNPTYAHTPIELVRWLQTACGQQSSKVPDADFHLYVLIDQASLPDWDEHAQQLTAKGVFKGELVNLYDDLEGQEIAKTGPVLAEVAQSNEALLTLTEFAINQDVASFLVADYDPSDHLRNIREVVMPDGSGALFRFQEPQSIAALWPLMTSGQIHRLLGPARLWAVRDVCGEVFSIVRQRTDQLEGAIQFTSENINALDEAMFPWTVATQIRVINKTLLKGMNGCEIRTLLNERISKGNSLGLKLRPDLSLYCALSLQLPTGFENKSPFAAALEKVRAGHSSFVSALDDVTSDEWLAVSEVE